MFSCAVMVDNVYLRTVTKAIPMLVLIFSIKTQNVYSKLILSGFILSLLGDVLLMKSVNMFVPGLIAFLFAHLLYIKAFVGKFSRLRLMSSLPFYAFAFFLALFLRPYLNDMLIPVIIYMFVVATMLWRAFMQKNISKISKYAWWGAVFFAFSDTNIAISKFYNDYYFSGIVIIVSYWTAQYLIYLSTLQIKRTD